MCIVFNNLFVFIFLYNLIFIFSKHMLYFVICYNALSTLCFAETIKIKLDLQFYYKIYIKIIIGSLDFRDTYVGISLFHSILKINSRSDVK